MFKEKVVPFILDVRLVDVPAGVSTGVNVQDFLIYLGQLQLIHGCYFSLLTLLVLSV